MRLCKTYALMIVKLYELKKGNDVRIILIRAQTALITLILSKIKLDLGLRFRSLSHLHPSVSKSPLSDVKCIIKSNK